jgi:hypothetical protein
MQISGGHEVAEAKAVESLGVRVSHFGGIADNHSQLLDARIVRSQLRHVQLGDTTSTEPEVRYCM